MLYHDPIADMLNRIRTAQAVKKPTVFVPHSRLKEEIASALAREGFIAGFSKKGRAQAKRLEIELLYHENSPRITGYVRKSRPGQRQYTGWKSLWPVRSGYGIAVLSTPRGVLSDKEARGKKVGGEIFFEIW